MPLLRMVDIGKRVQCALILGQEIKYFSDTHTRTHICVYMSSFSSLTLRCVVLYFKVKCIHPYFCEKYLNSFILLIRHSRFGGTYVVQNMKAIGENQMICHKPYQAIEDLEFGHSKVGLCKTITDKDLFLAFLRTNRDSLALVQ